MREEGTNRKMMAVAMALSMALALVACGGGASETKEDGGASSSESATLANPWTDVESAEEAAEGAGVDGLTMPDEGTELVGGQVGFYGYRYMELLAEADGYVGAAELTVRKGVANPGKEVGYDTEDVSGDFTAYAHEWTVDVGGREVTCHGNEEGQAMKATWQDGDHSYSIMVRGQGDVRDAYGLGDDDIATLVESIA